MCYIKYVLKISNTALVTLTCKDLLLKWLLLYDFIKKGISIKICKATFYENLTLGLPDANFAVPSWESLILCSSIFKVAFSTELGIVFYKSILQECWLDTWWLETIIFLLWIDNLIVKRHVWLT